MMRKNISFHRLLALILCVLVTVAMPFSVSAEGDSLWTDDDVRATDYEMRDDVNKVIQISTPEQLGLLAYEVNNGESFEGYTIILTNDIDLSKHLWEPIGKHTVSYVPNNTDHRFKGTFDGKNHVISGMTIVETSASRAIGFGLFGFIEDATVKNVCLKDSSISVSGTSTKTIYAGALVGSSFYECSISNCFVENVQVQVSGSSTVAAAGLIGFVYDRGSVKNCAVSGVQVTGETNNWNYLGGMMGYANAYFLEAQNCYATAISIEMKGTPYQEGKGLITGSSNGGTYVNCYAEGDLPMYQASAYNPSMTDSSLVKGNKLEQPVQVNGKEYTELDSALNAWVEQNGAEDYNDWFFHGGVIRQEGIYTITHQWESDYTVDQEPTCVTPGRKSIHCSDCTAVKDVQEIPATGKHSWSEWVQEDGKEVRTCSVCGETETRALAVSPETGDHAVDLWVGITAVALLAGSVFLFRRNRCGQ